MQTLGYAGTAILPMLILWILDAEDFQCLPVDILLCTAFEWGRTPYNDTAQ